jgi:tRNA(fMet)-specific endonuclease VapC
MLALDTNVWVRYLNPYSSPVKMRLHQQSLKTLWLCDIVKAELYYGAYKSTRQEQNLALLEKLFGKFKSWVFDSHADQLFGRIRADRQRQRKRIGPYDQQIAAIALANDLTHVTHNTGEFSRVNGLRLTDREV